MTGISELQFSLMRLNELADVCYKMSESKGWWDDPDWNFGEKIALIHSEASEALEEWRTHHATDEIYFEEDEQGIAKPEGIPIEFADIIVRVLDMCGKEKIDIGTALELKINYNKTRPHRHGGKLA